MPKFEILLKNGTSLETDSGEELANFFESDGKSIVARPIKVRKQPKRKRVKK